MTISENPCYEEKVIEDCNSLRDICNNLWPQLYELLERNEHKYFSSSILANINASIRSYEQEKIKISLRKKINRVKAIYYIKFRNENSDIKVSLFDTKKDIIDFAYVPFKLELYNTKEVMKKIREIKELEILKQVYSISGLSNCF